MMPDSLRNWISLSRNDCDSAQRNRTGPRQSTVRSSWMRTLFIWDFIFRNPVRPGGCSSRLILKTAVQPASMRRWQADMMRTMLFRNIISGIWKPKEFRCRARCATDSRRSFSDVRSPGPIHRGCRASISITRRTLIHGRSLSAENRVIRDFRPEVLFGVLRAPTSSFGMTFIS